MEASIMVEIDGETNTLKNWADKFQVPYISAYRRFKRGKTGADIFKVKSNTVRQYQTKSEPFVEMGQLNIAMPQWQIDQLERLAKLSGMKRTKYAHRILAGHINDTK
jgi:hypothetical protein